MGKRKKTVSANKETQTNEADLNEEIMRDIDKLEKQTQTSMFDLNARAQGSTEENSLGDGTKEGNDRLEKKEEKEKEMQDCGNCVAKENEKDQAPKCDSFDGSLRKKDVKFKDGATVMTGNTLEKRKPVGERKGVLKRCSSEVRTGEELINNNAENEQDR